MTVQDVPSGTVLTVIQPEEAQELHDRITELRQACLDIGNPPGECGSWYARGSASVTFSPSGRYLLTQYSWGSGHEWEAEPGGYVWDAQSGELVTTHDILKGNLEIEAVYWSPDEQALAYQMTARDQFPLKVTTISGNGETAIEGGKDFEEQYSAWQADKVGLYAQQRGQNNDYIFSQSPQLCTFIITTIDEPEEVKARYCYGNSSGIKWSDNGQYIETILGLSNSEYARNWALNWDIKTGLPVGFVDAQQEEETPVDTGIRNNIVEHTNEYFWPSAGTYELILNNQIIHTFDEPPFGITWSPDGTKFAVGFGNHIRIYDQDGVLLIHTESPGYQPYLHGFAYPTWSPDGTRIASGSTYLDFSGDPCGLNKSDDMGSVVIWDVDTGNIVDEWLAHSGGVDEVAFNPTGNLLASQGRTGEIVIWEIGE